MAAQAQGGGQKKTSPVYIGELEERVRLLELQAREVEARLRLQTAKAQLNLRRGVKEIPEEE